MNILEELKNIDFKNIDFKSKQAQMIILAALVALLAIVLYFYFVFFPQVGRVMKLIGKTGKVRAELISARNAISDTAKLKKRLEDYSAKVESYEKKLPAEQEIPSLLENLSTMAKESNIKIVGIAPAMPHTREDGGAKDQAYQEMPILISAKSGYHELGFFLSKLENSDRFMKVADIDIRANKSSPRKHDVELLVLTYILLPEK